MNIGWCAPLEKAELVKRTGYDYAEIPLAAFGLEDDASLVSAKQKVSATPLPTPVFNWFFPQDMRIVGPDINEKRIRGYLGRASALMHHAGAESAVLGSGWARNVPDNWERSRAEAQILQTLSWCAEAFAGSGVVIGIEAQNRKETNIITSVEEAASYAAKVNRPEIAIMADFYHMDEEHEPFDVLKRHAKQLVHIQLADTGRRNPGTGSYDYAGFFNTLKECGYKGRISVECMIEIPEDEMRRSAKFLKSFWRADPGMSKAM
jgi:sugar phosphate isomerase/epimerase